jgi:hypothetical protein
LRLGVASLDITVVPLSPCPKDGLGANAFDTAASTVNIAQVFRNAPTTIALVAKAPEADSRPATKLPAIVFAQEFRVKPFGQLKFHSIHKSIKGNMNFSIDI